MAKAYFAVGHLNRPTAKPILSAGVCHERFIVFFTGFAMWLRHAANIYAESRSESSLLWG